MVIIGAGFGGWVRSRGITDGSVFGHGPDRTLYPQLAPVVMEAGKPFHARDNATMATIG